MTDEKKMKAVNRLSDDDLEKVSGGAGAEYEEVCGYKFSPRASWCPHCQQEVEPDSMCGPQMLDGVYGQVFSCEKCNGQYVAPC